MILLINVLSKIFDKDYLQCRGTAVLAHDEQVTSGHDVNSN